MFALPALNYKLSLFASLFVRVRVNRKILSLIQCRLPKVKKF